MTSEPLSVEMAHVDREVAVMKRFLEAAAAWQVAMHDVSMPDDRAIEATAEMLLLRARVASLFLRAVARHWRHVSAPNSAEGLEELAGTIQQQTMALTARFNPPSLEG